MGGIEQNLSQSQGVRPIIEAFRIDSKPESPGTSLNTSIIGLTPWVVGRWFLTGKNLASSKILVYTFPLYTRKVRGEGIPWIRLC